MTPVRLKARRRPVPTITSAASLNVNEGVTLAHTLVASEASTFAIVGGLDAAQFEISGSTLRWSSNGTRSYSAPADSDANNSYAVRVVPTRNSDSYAGPAQSITVTVSEVVVAPGAPGFADQTIEAGRLTRSGVVATEISATNTPTSWEILSGDAAGHLAIATGAGGRGEISITAAGQGNLSASYTLSVRATNAAGNTTRTITLNTVAGRLDVNTAAQFNTAKAVFGADLTATWQVNVREVITSGVTISGLLYTASLVDANDGAAEVDYNRNATASFSGGGSLTFLSATGRGGFRGTDASSSSTAHGLTITSCRAVTLSGLTVPRVAAETSNSAYPGIKINKTAALSASTVIIKNCALGPSDLEISVYAWPNCIDAYEAEQVVIEDCTFSHYFKAIVSRHVQRTAIRRNHFSGYREEDCIDFLLSGSSQSTTMTYGDRRCEVTDNIILPAAYLPEHTAAHSDGIQAGAAADDRGYDFFIKWNWIAAEQACFLSGSATSAAAHMYGVIANNFLACCNSHGLSIMRVTAGKTLAIRNNTIVKDTPNWLLDEAGYTGGSSAAEIRSSVKTGANADGVITLTDNIFQRFVFAPTSTVVSSDAGFPATWSNGTPAPTASGNAYVGFASTVGATYPNHYAGPSSAPANPEGYTTDSNFRYKTGSGASRWIWEWRADDCADFKTDVDTIFTPDAGSPAEGVGHLS